MDATITFYTVSEVAEMLKCKKTHVYDLINQNRLKAFRLSPRRTRISSESLNDLIKEETENVAAKFMIAQLPRKGGRPRKHGN